MKPVLIRRHSDAAPPGVLVEWLQERGIPYVVSDSANGDAPDPRDHSFVASLGSRFNPNDTHEPTVVAELELIKRAVADDVPVLGLCYGGQVLAAVLGGDVHRAPTAELGWITIQTDEPGAIPAGPWLAWHYERFTVPPGATEIARTPDATHAFRHGRHLALQFHPEATVEIVDGWALHDMADDVQLAVSDEQRAAARAAAFRLFDAFYGSSVDNVSVSDFP